MFQQKLQLSGGPDRTAGVWLARVCGLSIITLSKELVGVVTVAVVVGCRSTTATARIRREPTACSVRGRRTSWRKSVVYVKYILVKSVLDL